MNDQTEKEIIINNRGMIKIKNSYIKCFLGKYPNIKSSEEIYEEKKNVDNEMESFYTIGEETFFICYPIPIKYISIITNDGKKYNSTVYFPDDIKNIISGFQMKKPFYLEKGQYKAFNYDDNYYCFLLNNDINEIKDLFKEKFDFKNTENKFNEYHNEFQNKKSVKLNTINRNIYLYSKIDNINEEIFFITQSRSLLFYQLNLFCKNKKRDEINDLIYGIFGNYASGNSFFLMYFNFKSSFPCLYLNLKALKNANNTNSFPDIINNEIMTLFFKLNKNYEDFKNFISSFLPYEDKSLEILIISIIIKLKNEEIIIIIDQYNKELFGNENFIIQLKQILFNENSKIKLIISSSLNDNSIREEYLKMFFGNNNYKEENKNNINNYYIPYYFIAKLIDTCDIQKFVDKFEKKDNNKFIDTLNLFNSLPLYFDLCRQYIENLDKFILNTTERIENKILKFFGGEINLKFMDEIRKMIDNEITIEDLNFYSKYIPFKYFYIEKNNETLILKTHFPLVNKVWNTIIMKNTVDLFDGEIEYYNGSVIGSLMELNLITNIKSRKIQLDIDSFITVDTINDFKIIVEKDTDKFENKNIFITQKNSNGQNFDIAYIKGKNEKFPKITYIQVKKCYSSNRIDKEKMKNIFEKKKENFKKLLNFIPSEANLIYITLINNKIKNAINIHDDYKKDKLRKVSNLNYEVNSIVYSFNQLRNFCFEYGIQLYYYEPKTHLFYINEDNNFVNVKLDLLRVYDNKFNLIFNHNHIINEFNKNKDICNIINENYNEFLNKKRNNKKFLYKINEFNFGIVFDFAKNYFNNIKIENFVDLQNTHLECEYYNLTKQKAILCIKKINKNEYNIDSFVYNNIFIKVNDNNLIIEKSDNSLDRGNDILVIINFDSINYNLKALLNNK